MTTQYVFTLIAIGQGCFSVGLTVFILLYYLPNRMKKVDDPLRWHIIFVSISYILLTMATIHSAVYLLYSWGDAWHWMVTIGYALGDISLVFVFKDSVREKRIKEIDEENNNNNKNDNNEQ